VAERFQLRPEGGRYHVVDTHRPGRGPLIYLGCPCGSGGAASALNGLQAEAERREADLRARLARAEAVADALAARQAIWDRPGPWTAERWAEYQRAEVALDRAREQYAAGGEVDRG
jgi:hypothetical protein